MPREGGAERQIRQVLTRLASEGFTCTVLTQSVDDVPRRASIDDIEVVRISRASLFRRVPRLAAGWFLLEAAFRAVTIRPDVVVTLMLGAQSAAGGLASMAIGVPHILRLTGGGGGRGRSEPMAKSSTYRGRQLIRLSTCNRPVIVAPSNHLLEDFVESVGIRRARSLRHLPNGVTSAVGEVPSECDRHDVAWYSRRGTYQSVADVVSIASILPELSFTTFGRSLEGKLPSNVKDVGWTDKPEILLSKHRVLLNTSQYEGSPNVALQALSVGCCVVGYENRGLNELKEQYPGRVRVAAYGDVEALAAAVSASLREYRVQRSPTVTVSHAAARWRALVEELITQTAQDRTTNGEE